MDQNELGINYESCMNSIHHVKMVFVILGFPKTQKKYEKNLNTTNHFNVKKV